MRLRQLANSIQGYGVLWRPDILVIEPLEGVGHRSGLLLQPGDQFTLLLQRLLALLETQKMAGNKLWREIQIFFAADRWTQPGRATGTRELVGVLAESVKHPADFVGLGLQLLDEGSLLRDLVFAFLAGSIAF